MKKSTDEKHTSKPNGILDDVINNKISELFDTHKEKIMEKYKAELIEVVEKLIADRYKYEENFNKKLYQMVARIVAEEFKMRFRSMESMFERAIDSNNGFENIMEKLNDYSEKIGDVMHCVGIENRTKRLEGIVFAAQDAKKI